MSERNSTAVDGLVSVIVPAYNQGRWIAETLDSVRAQDYEHWECIVVNDGSTDDTLDIVERYVALDPRFKLISQPNSGVSAARNKGLEAVRGQYIQFLDGDDILLPEKLRVQVKALEDMNGDVHICAVQVKCFRDAATHMIDKVFHAPTDLADPFSSFLSHWEVDYVVPIQAFLLRTEPLRKNHVKYNPGLYSHEDWDFWLQLMACRPKVFTTDSVLAHYRVHGDGVTANRYRCWKGYLQSLAIQRKRYRDVPGMEAALTSHYRRMHRKYRKSFPFRETLINLLLDRPWFANHCPWPIQRSLREFCGF